MKGLRDKKAKLYDQTKKIQEKIDVLEHERNSLQKNLPQRREDQVPANIRKNIDDMHKRYETTTMKPQDEKKLLADIKKMRD